MSRRLNPHAPVFVPRSSVPNTHVTKFALGGAEQNHPWASCDQNNESKELFEILPDEVGRDLLFAWHLKILLCGLAWI